MNGVPDISTEIFEALTGLLGDIYPGTEFSDVEEHGPEAFPLVTIIERSNTTYLPTADSGGIENHSQLVYEVGVYTTGEGMVKKARHIMSTTSEFFMSMGFGRIYCQPAPNEDVDYHQLIARYEAIIDRNKKTFLGGAQNAV